MLEDIHSTADTTSGVAWVLESESVRLLDPVGT